MRKKNEKRMIYQLARGNGKSAMFMARMSWELSEPPKWKIISHIKWRKAEPKVKFIEVNINDI